MAVFTGVPVRVSVSSVRRTLLSPVQHWNMYQDNSYNHKDSRNFSDTKEVSIVLFVL